MLPRSDLLMFGWLHLTNPPAPALFAQLLIGLINGAFYAMLSLGLAVIFVAMVLLSLARKRLKGRGAEVRTWVFRQQPPQKRAAVAP